MRLHAVSAALSGAGLLACLAAAPALAVSVSAPLPLAACPTDVAATPDGAVQLLTRTQRRGRWSAAVSSVSPAGMLTPGLTVSRPWRRPDAVRSVFTRDGLAVAYESGQPKPELVRIGFAGRASVKPKVSALVAGPGGTTAPQVLSDPTRRADLYRISSQGGATVVQFRQSVRGALWLQTWVAVRPAGATRFRRAVSLQSPMRARFSDDRVYLGPDGSGLVLSTPSMSKLPVSARRITADGRIGPAMAVTDRRTDIARATAAVGPTGEIAVAVVDTAKPDRYRREGVFLATLAPGAQQFSPPRLVTTERGDLTEGLALTIDGTGQTHAVAFVRFFPEDPADYRPRFLTLSGRGDQLVRGPDIEANAGGQDPPTLVASADGTVAFTWEGIVRATGGDGDEAYRNVQQVAFRAADGSWTAPTAIVPPPSLQPDVRVERRGSAVLPDGGLAIAYSTGRYAGPSACALVRVMP